MKGYGDRGEGGGIGRGVINRSWMPRRRMLFRRPRGQRSEVKRGHSAAYLSTTTSALSSKMTWCRFFSPCSVTKFIVCRGRCAFTLTRSQKWGVWSSATWMREVRAGHCRSENPFPPPPLTLSPFYTFQITALLSKPDPRSFIFG